MQKRPIILLLLTLLLMSAIAHAQPWQQVGNDIDGDTLDQSGWNTSINANGKVVVVGAPYNDSTGVDAGRVKVYEFNGSAWQQLGNDIFGEAAGDKSGTSTSISADGYTVAIGAPYNDGAGVDAGRVRIYRYIASAWQQLGSDIDGAGAAYLAGRSVSLSSDGNTVAIGVSGNNFNTGHTSIYSFNGSSWQQVGADIGAEALYDQAGFSVSLNAAGTTVAIGAPNNDGIGSNAGHVRVFTYNGSSWQQIGGDIDGEATGDNSGEYVSISSDGGTVAIGAQFNSSPPNTYAGHVRIYRYNGGIWQQLGVDIDGYFLNDRSGSVSISGDGNTVAIGAYVNDASGNGSGHVRVYTYNGSAWQQLGGDLNGEKAGDGSGYSTGLSTDGYTVAIGAPGSDTNGPSSGHVKVYDICIPTSSTDTIMVCDSIYTWIDSVAYTTSNTTATHLLVNARGCDSLVSLNLTINTSVAYTDVQIACDSFTWIDSVVYTASNTTASHLLSTAGGCDSLVTLNLSLFNSNSATDIITACDSLVWIDGITYTANNNSATHNLSNVGGCDSLVTLDLTITNSSAATDVQTACDTFIWIDGNTYTSSNTSATHILPNILGCDSVVTLDLTLLNNGAATDVQIACDSITWMDGNTYTSSNNTATYIILGGSTNGCDSVITLNLTINSNMSTDVQIICDSVYTWIDGITYFTNNTTAIHTLTNVAGCDSVVTLNLTINANVTGSDSIVACETYTWIDGNTYNSSNTVGTFNIAGGASNGCDSLVYLNLTIINVDVSTTNNDPLLTANATGVAYQWLACDSNYMVIIGETTPIFNPSINGNYAVEITDNGCVDTSACVTVAAVGVAENNLLTGVSIFPNPTQGEVSIALGNLKEITLKVFSVTGQLIKVVNNINTPLYQFKLNKASGVYFVELSNKEIIQRFKLIKK